MTEINLIPEDPFQKFEPDPLWTPTNVSRPCKCGWYTQEDGSFMHWYCSMEHFLDD